MRATRGTVPSGRAFRAVAGGLVGVLVGASLVAQQPQQAAPPPAVELPTYVVTDTRVLPPPESWRYAAGSGYEVLSQVSARRTQELLKEFTLFREAIRVVFPSLAPKIARPVTLIFSGRSSLFGDLAASGRIDPAENAHALGDRDGAFIVLNLGLNTESVGVASLGAINPPADANGVEAFESDPFKGLKRQYARSLYVFDEARLPAWAEEGLTWLITGMEYDTKRIRFASLQEPTIDRSFGEAVEDENPLTPPPSGVVEGNGFHALKESRLMTFPRMMAVTHDEAEVTSDFGRSWAIQSAAFVHLCLYGEGRRYQRGFLNYVQKLGREAPTEELFKASFGKSYAQMLMELRLYVGGALYEAFDFNAKGAGFVGEPPPVLREATQSEVGRIKGPALMLAGNVHAARLALTAPYARGERDPRLLAVLGLAERAAGNTVLARASLEAAFAGKVVRPRAHLELARLRLAEAREKISADGKLDATQAAWVRQPLLLARTQPPALPEVYELFAEIWDRSAVGPSPEQLVVLEEGVKLFPDRLELVYRTAVWEMRVGRFEQATGLVDYGSARAGTAVAKARFAELKAALPTTRGENR